jgi:hypothetical protein
LKKAATGVANVGEQQDGMPVLRALCAFPEKWFQLTRRGDGTRLLFLQKEAGLLITLALEKVNKLPVGGEGKFFRQVVNFRENGREVGLWIRGGNLFNSLLQFDQRRQDLPFDFIHHTNIRFARDMGTFF